MLEAEEYFEHIEDLPSDLKKYWKILMQDKYQALLYHTGVNLS
jgi:hypothetical protein